MKKRDKLTPSELDRLLAIHQSVITIITFFAGFVFVTIPVVLFSVDVSSIYGRFILYLLLSSLIVFLVALDLHHANVLRAYKEAIPVATRVTRAHIEPRLADQLMGIGMFLASISISFMLLLEGPEWIIEAAVWLVASAARVITGHALITRSLSPSRASPQL